jgi:hypothetical protein
MKGKKMSQTNGFFPALFARFTARRQTLAERYSSLVRSVADDKPPKPDDVEQLLLQMAKTPSDLQVDVERFIKRREAAQKIDAAKAADAERQQCNSDMAAAEKKRDAAVSAILADFAKTAEVIVARVRILDRLIKDAADAERFLLDSAAIPGDVQTEIAALKRQRDELSVALIRHDSAAHAASIESRDLHAQAKALYVTADVNAARLERAVEYDQVEAAASAEAKKLEQQVAELDRRRDELERLALVP